MTFFLILAVSFYLMVCVVMGLMVQHFLGNALCQHELIFIVWARRDTAKLTRHVPERPVYSRDRVVYTMSVMLPDETFVVWFVDAAGNILKSDKKTRYGRYRFFRTSCLDIPWWCKTADDCQARLSVEAYDRKKNGNLLSFNHGWDISRFNEWCIQRLLAEKFVMLKLSSAMEFAEIPGEN